MFNKRAGYDKDARYLFSGKDGVIYDGDGVLLSTIESFQVQITFNEANYQPLGSPIQQVFLTGYSVALVVSQAIIEDDKFVQDVFDFMHVGRHAPMWNFQSTLFGYDGSESRYIFRDCVPTGNLDLQNMTVGDIIRRNWNMRVNQPPDLQKLLTYPN